MFPQKLNAYSYSMNNPIVYTDVSGEDVLVWDWNGNPLEVLAKAYVWAVVFMWTYLADKVIDYVDDK
jgi:hypothetical protein